ncbi:tetratricopeptide repeat protein [Candidatus Amarolinea aalborgensis]|jgi:tetratricopeptide (TPR) repeat protein|uniref:tetratricopeptide repeat protein n=1 Tax=Candidatus Amarolinea aalborgensis TaxID=2249329 RepID=UPI003BF986B1
MIFSPAPGAAHQLEYFRLAIAQDDDGGTHRWADRFVHAWMDNAVAECRLLLTGIKGSGVQLSPHSQAVALRCQSLLELLLEDYDRSEADFLRSLALLDETGDDFNASRVLNDLGTLHQARGELPSAVARYRQALARLLLGWTGTSEEAMIRNNLGLALISSGDDTAGAAELEQARALYDQLGQPQGVARAQINLGQVYRRRGELARASAAYEEALQVLRRHGEQRAVIDVLNNLGILARHQGLLDQAMTYYTDSLVLAQQVGDLGGQAQALGNLGAIYHEQGLLERARPCYREALAHYESLGDLRGQGLMWGNLGQLEGLEDRPEDALAAHQRSLDLYRQAGANLDAGIAQVNLAGALRALDRQDEAEGLYLSAAETGRRLDDLRLQDRALGGLGILRSMQGRFDEARALLEQTLDLERQRRDIPAQIETLYKFGVVARDEGQKEAQLAEILRPAWDLAQEHDAGRWLVVIAWLLGDAAVDERLPQAYNYYATAAAIARQHGDERRYRVSMDAIRRNVEELIEHGRAEDAAFVCRYVVEFWEQMELARWVEDAVAEVKSWTQTPAPPRPRR